MLLRRLALLGVSTAIAFATPVWAGTVQKPFPVAPEAAAEQPQQVAAVTRKKTKKEAASTSQKGKKVARKGKKAKPEAEAAAKKEAKPLTRFEKKLLAEKKRKEEIAARTAAIRAKKAEEAEKRAAALARKADRQEASARIRKPVEEAKNVDTRRKKKAEDTMVLASAPVGTAKSAVARQVLPSQSAVEVATIGNNGELRSENLRRNTGFMAVLFGDGEEMLPQTRALDAKLAERETVKGKFQVRDEYMPQTVAFSGYPTGTIVIDTRKRFLYLVESSSSARRYAIAVGREGLEFKGTATVGDKQEWPRWIPTQDMQKREPKKYGQYKDGMPGGLSNPLGARAIYLYQGKTDTHIRIHGTNAPETIGTNSSNGCFRMVNDHVMDLYSRVPMGTQVVVL